MTSVIQNVMGLKTGLLLVAIVLVASSLATRFWDIYIAETEIIPEHD